MSWRDEMRPGSFRDVKFQARSADGEVGRRIVLHEYPDRDLGYPEDLGGKTQPFILELIVVGPDYMSVRDRLIEALNTSGPGILVHPWRGELKVSVLRARGPRESNRQGGMASFVVTFVEAGDNRQPTEQSVTERDLKDQADASRKHAQNDFAAAFDVTGPEYLAASARSILQQAADRFDQLSRQIAAPGQQAAELVADVAAFTTELTSLLHAPGDLAVRLLGLAQDLGNLADKPLGAIEIYRLLFGFGDDDPAVSQITATRKQQATNQAAVASLVRQVALIEAIEKSADHAYQSSDQAISLRDLLLEQLDRETETADDALYFELTELRVALVRDIAARGQQLPRLIQYTPLATQPAILLAYRLYGDPERAAEVVERNRLAHPGFVPGGQPIEVLSDV